jgi:hypothetical protein
MKLTSLVVLFSAAFFAVARAQAQIGDGFQALVARWGEPQNALSLAVGMGEWDLKNGAKVVALLMDGKTQFVLWRGIDAKLFDTLLQRNLPSGATWVDGKDAKEWAKTGKSLFVNLVDVLGVTVKQTSDHKLWCIYTPDTLFLGTPQGFDRMNSLALLLNNTEKEP